MNYFFTILLILLAAVSQASFAAVTANATASPSTTTINHPVAVSLSLVNGGASILTVTNIQLTATSTQNPGSSRLPYALSQFNFGPNAVPITLSGGNAITIVPGPSAVFFSPSTGITGSGSGTYTIGGTLYFSDGSNASITNGATVTINPIPLPLYERQ